jgi:hypothetical protein
MSAIKLVPVSLDVAIETLVVLRAFRIRPSTNQPGDPDLERVAVLIRTIGEAIAIAGEHRDANEMLVLELLELIGRTTGRQLSTIPGPTSLAEAEEALRDLAPVLGKVLSMPRAPERESAKAIEAEAARALADMPGPISVRLWVDHVEREPFDTWAVPAVGHVEAMAGQRARIYLVKRTGPNMFEVFAVSLCKKEDETW